MDKIVLYKTINTDGTYTCGDVGISAEEWYTLLNKEKAKSYIDVLVCFFARART